MTSRLSWRRNSHAPDSISEEQTDELSGATEAPFTPASLSIAFFSTFVIFIALIFGWLSFLFLCNWTPLQMQILP